MGSRFRFCALVLAMSICGCSGMGVTPPKVKNRQVDLKVSTDWTCSASQAGCKHVYDNTNVAKFTCLFTGGDNGYGDLTFDSMEGPNVRAQVHLKGASTFSMEDITFINDHGQLNRTLDTNKKLGTIVDFNTALQTAYYAVTVSDNRSSGSPLTVVCDPRIVNN